MTKKQKLELTWIGKDNRAKLEPRILLEEPSLSYHAAHRVTESDIFDNRLIFGDNLLALKAEFAGKVKCVFIDPPYNTGSAFEHYDDTLEHSTWLCLMRDRLEVIRRLLSPSGFICCHIDDSEGHYLKVLMDEVFGRSNDLGNRALRARLHRGSADFRASGHPVVHEFGSICWSAGRFQRLDVERLLSTTERIALQSAGAEVLSNG